MTTYTVGVENMYGTVEVELPDDYDYETMRDAVWDAIENGKLNIKDFEVGDAW